jgi:glyoxylase-like metal-dependent hydrolase (beta-lactamase superfamily II)
MTDESFRLHVLPATNGDALVLEYGHGQARQRVLIDGGRSSAAPKVKAFLGEDPELELLIVTHIDNDHIGGLLRLLRGPASPRPADIWFNGYRHLPESSLQEMGPVA